MCVCVRVRLYVFLVQLGMGKYRMGIVEKASGSLVVVVLLVYNYKQLKNIYAS